jgi:hypothetical protein
MRGIIVIAATVALWSAAVCAQSLPGTGTGRSKGSTGPTFPDPRSNALIATAPLPSGAGTGLQGEPDREVIATDRATPGTLDGNSWPSR